MADRFNPVRFNAEEWADLVLESGARHFLITSKHHDGFCLWDTPSTDFKRAVETEKRDNNVTHVPALRSTAQPASDLQHLSAGMARSLTEEVGPVGLRSRHADYEIQPERFLTVCRNLAPYRLLCHRSLSTQTVRRA
ncbi:MAG: alpha-L-fucosidase, partial [Planctomycetota bacterium]